MKVLIHGVHLNVTPELKAYVERRLARALERLVDNEAAELDVMLKDSNGPKGGEDKECSVTLRLPGSAGLHVTERTADIRLSIDRAEDRLFVAAEREREKKRRPSGHPVPKPATRLGR